MPELVRTAIATVVRDMRDIPRELIDDPAEVMDFLARQARRLDGIRAMWVPMRSRPRLSRPAPS